jgi:uncharacterized protein (TIGR03437 family)
VVEIYANGLGPVSNPPDAASAAVADPLSRTLGETIVQVGGLRAAVLYSGLAPGLAGVYQINARIPEQTPTGSRVPVTIQVGESGLRSSAAGIAVD